MVPGFVLRSPGSLFTLLSIMPCLDLQPLVELEGKRGLQEGDHLVLPAPGDQQGHCLACSGPVSSGGCKGGKWGEDAYFEG